MNWLKPLTDKILEERASPVEQRRALVLCANELAAICDQHVPLAPAPELLKLSDTLWIAWTINDRHLSVGAAPFNRLVLEANDGTLGTDRQVDPTHQALRRNLLCLFGGWAP